MIGTCGCSARKQIHIQMQRPTVYRSDYPSNKKWYRGQNEYDTPGLILFLKKERKSRRKKRKAACKSCFPAVSIA